MNDGILPGINRALPEKPDLTGTELVVIQHALRRVLAFTGHTIDDVIHNPIARNRVIGYYNLHCWIEQQCEISDLERQWNLV